VNLEPWMIAVAGAAGFLILRRALGAGRAPPAEVLRRIQAGAKIVDVRTPGEFARGAYPGAINVPLAELGERLDRIPKERPVVVYCASGMRSASAARLLARAGYADVVNGGGLRHMPR